MNLALPFTTKRMAKSYLYFHPVLRHESKPVSTCCISNKGYGCDCRPELWTHFDILPGISINLLAGV